jgi:hypothetical protein
MSCEPTDRLLQTLRVHVPGATDDLLSLELFNVMDEFFRRTNAWRHDTDIQLQLGINEYNFAVPIGSEMVRVLGVMHNAVPVPSRSALETTYRSVGAIDSEMVFADGDALYGPDLANIDAGNVFSWAVYRPDYLTVSVPGEEALAYPLKVALVLSISRDCLEEECGSWEIPEWMWPMFFTDWLDGTLARLYGMPAKPWSNPQIGVYHGRRFRNHLAYRKQESNHGFIYNPPPSPWRFPRGW